MARVFAALEAGKGAVYLVVPSTRAAEIVLRRLQAARPDMRYPRQLAVTFPQLYETVLTSLGHRLFVQNALARARLLGEVIGDLAEEGALEYFAETADRPGLVGAVGALIDELWQSDTGPAEFARLATRRAAKDRDLAAIFARCAETLEVLNATDAEGLGYAAARRLKEALAADAERGTGLPALARRFELVAADGFDFYTPVQVSLLQSLTRAGVPVAATLTYEENRAVHLWQQPTRRRFAEAGAEIIECRAAPLTNIEKTAARFMEEDGEGRESSASPEDESSIQVISAPDRAAEVRAAAREIKRLVIEEGLSLEDVTVVCRSLSLYGHHVERVFGECGIPARIDAPLALSENPLIVALLNLLNISNVNFARRAVMESLRSPHFDLSPFSIDEAAADRFDCLSVERNITGGIEQWLKGVDEGAGESEAEAASAGPDLRAFFDLIRLPRAAPREQYRRAITRIVRALRVEEMIAAGPHAVRDREAFGAFVSVLDNVLTDAPAGQAARRRAGQPAAWSRLFAEIQRAAAATPIAWLPLAGPALTVQELRNLLPRRYRAIFVFGLIEGEFPARLAERAPYSLFERDELRRAGIDFSETTDDAGADLMQFYKVMSRAGERLYLSYARTDIAGGELLPSYLLEEVGPCRELTVQLTAIEMPRPASLEELSQQVARQLARQSPAMAAGRLERAEALLSRELPAWEAARRGARAEQSRMIQAGDSPFAGAIVDPELVEALRRQFGPKYLWSATQLNDYGACPFRFFARYALKLASRAEPGEGFAANILGSAYHEILEGLYRRAAEWPEGAAGRTAVELRELILEVSEPVFERVVEAGSVRRTALWEYEKAEVRERLLKILLADAEWNSTRPVEFERHFGSKGTPPLRIDSRDGAIRICGVVDRIDESDEGLVVIDYKTSSGPISLRDALAGRNLQLPIYLLAAHRVIQPEARLAGGYYLHIYSGRKGPTLPRRGKEEVTAEEVMERAEAFIRDYVGRARRGRFPVRPNGGECFANCEYETACRIRVVRHGTSQAGE